MDDDTFEFPRYGNLHKLISHTKHYAFNVIAEMLREKNKEQRDNFSSHESTRRATINLLGSASNDSTKYKKIDKINHCHSSEKSIRPENSLRNLEINVLLFSFVICPWPGSGECCLQISEMNKTMTLMSNV